MLKSRNSFFQEAQFSSQSIMPNIPGNPYYMQAPVNASSASQSYYSGPAFNQGAMNQNNFDDYENRLAKIERQINRLDARISKLESANKIESIDMSSNMYMV